MAGLAGMITGVLALAVASVVMARPHSEEASHAFECVRDSHNKTVFMDAFRGDVSINLTDVAYLHHLECQDCTGCGREKYYGTNDDGVLWAKEPCNGTFLVYYFKDNQRYMKTVHLDASRHNVKTSMFSHVTIDKVECIDCHGCQGSFGFRETHFHDAAGNRVTRKQVWAKAPCQGYFRLDYLKAYCTNITLKGDKSGTIRARHVYEPCEDGNIFRMEMLPGEGEGHCEFGRDVYFHKDIIFYGDCSATFEVCEVAPYEDMDHEEHALSDHERSVKEYWDNKYMNKYILSKQRMGVH